MATSFLSIINIFCLLSALSSSTLRFVYYPFFLSSYFLHCITSISLFIPSAIFSFLSYTLQFLCTFSFLPHFCSLNVSFFLASFASFSIFLSCLSISFLFQLFIHYPLSVLIYFIFCSTSPYVHPLSFFFPIPFFLTLFVSLFRSFFYSFLYLFLAIFSVPFFLATFPFINITPYFFHSSFPSIFLPSTLPCVLLPSFIC